MSYLIKTREIGDYRINVFQDDNADCPCSELDFFVGLYIWKPSDWRKTYISSFCNWQELFGEYGGINYSMYESLKRLICEYVPEKKIIEYINSDECREHCRIRYDKSEHMWYLEYYQKYDWTKELWHTEESFTPSEFRDYDNRDIFCRVLDITDLVSLLRDCKNIAFYEWQSRDYCQGDCVDGFAYCDKERFSKMCDKNTKNWRQRALELFKDEVKKLGMWMWGDVKYYTLEKKVPYKKVFTEIGREPEDCFNWEEIDSVSGYYMDADDLIDQVIAEHGITDKDAA